LCVLSVANGRGLPKLLRMGLMNCHPQMYNQYGMDGGLKSLTACIGVQVAAVIIRQ
jgi:hypothetical protein